jgi:hypothetical protein
MTKYEKKLAIALLTEKLQNITGKRVIFENDEYDNIYHKVVEGKDDDKYYDTPESGGEFKGNSEDFTAITDELTLQSLSGEELIIEVINMGGHIIPTIYLDGEELTAAEEVKSALATLSSNDRLKAIKFLRKAKESDKREENDLHEENFQDREDEHAIHKAKLNAIAERCRMIKNEKELDKNKEYAQLNSEDKQTVFELIFGYEDHSNFKENIDSKTKELVENLLFVIEESAYDPDEKYNRENTEKYVPTYVRNYLKGKGYKFAGASQSKENEINKTSYNYKNGDSKLSYCDGKLWDGSNEVSINESDDPTMEGKTFEKRKNSKPSTKPQPKDKGKKYKPWEKEKELDEEASINDNGELEGYKEPKDSTKLVTGYNRHEVNYGGENEEDGDRQAFEDMEVYNKRGLDIIVNGIKNGQITNMGSLRQVASFAGFHGYPVTVLGKMFKLPEGGNLEDLL